MVVGYLGEGGVKGVRGIGADWDLGGGGKEGRCDV